jgi:hypothetical protein
MYKAGDGQGGVSTSTRFVDFPYSALRQNDAKPRCIKKCNVRQHWAGIPLTVIRFTTGMQAG